MAVTIRPSSHQVFMGTNSRGQARQTISQASWPLLYSSRRPNWPRTVQLPLRKQQSSLNRDSNRCSDRHRSLLMTLSMMKQKKRWVNLTIMQSRQRDRRSLKRPLTKVMSKSKPFLTKFCYQKSAKLRLIIQYRLYQGVPRTVKILIVNIAETLLPLRANIISLGPLSQGSKFQAFKTIHKSSFSNQIRLAWAQVVVVKTASSKTIIVLIAPRVCYSVVNYLMSMV